MTPSRLACAVLLVLALVQGRPAETAVAAQAPATVDSSYLNLLRWRSLGPSRGNRCFSGAPLYQGQDEQHGACET